MSDGLALDSRIFVAGHRGLVGTAILRHLTATGHTNLLVRTHSELDLTDQHAVADFFRDTRPEYVVLAAAKVGGIVANDRFPGEFIQQNLAIQTNVLHQSWLNRVRRLLFLGSSCIYPRDCPQPIKEEYLLTGPLEPTNDAYAIAKIAGIQMCAAYNRQYGTNFLCLMPTNLFGAGDNYNPQTSHVVPALIRKAHAAKISGAESFVAWGTGSPRRELLFSDDLAAAAMLSMQISWSEFERATGGLRYPLINVGAGKDCSIKELASLVCDVVGFRGTIEWDVTKPDGTPQKLLDSERIQSLGWISRTPLRQGLEATYAAYKKTIGYCIGVADE